MNITISKANSEPKEYPLQWGFGCIEKYCDLMGCADIEGLNMIMGMDEYMIPIPKRITRKAIVSLIYAAILNGCDLADVPCDLEYKHVSAHLDDVDQSVYEGYISDFNQSKLSGKTIQEWFSSSTTETNDKKKELA